MELTWARPLSISAVTDTVALFFQVVGRGTSRLARLAPGDRVQMVGPLGNAFERNPESRALLLAGGVGLAPFIGYVQQHPRPENLKLLFGHRPDIAYYPYAALADKIATEHFQERKAEDLHDFLALIEKNIALFAKEDAQKNTGLILACGPLPFLRAVQKAGLRYMARTQISLEARMACGVGACLGCVVKPLLDEAGGRNKSAHPVPEQMHKALPVPSCTCGPVFWADSVDLD
jgi:dihydroorotate dehydrogenase electron transfer subunit